MYGYVCMHVCIALYLWLRIYGSVFVATYLWPCMYGYVCMYVWLCRYVCVCVSCKLKFLSLLPDVDADGSCASSALYLILFP